MNCVPKEYDIKTKMVQEQWLQLKMMFLLGYNLVGRESNFWGKVYWEGRGIFQVGENDWIFDWWEGGVPDHSPLPSQ